MVIGVGVNLFRAGVLGGDAGVGLGPGGSDPATTSEIEILTRAGDTILTRAGDTIIARAA